MLTTARSVLRRPLNYALSSKNAHPTNLTVVRSWVRGSTPVKAALLHLSVQPSTLFNEPNNLLKVQRREAQELNESNQRNKRFHSVSWMHVASWGCHIFSSDLEQCRLSTAMWYVSVLEVWHVILTLVLKVKQS